MTRRRILVTGGAGFIGGAVVRRLVGKGHRIVNLDSLTYSGNLASLNSVADDPSYRFVQADIAELEKAAAEGDEEARKALEEDPLTENEDDAFILRWLASLLRKLGLMKEAEAEAEAEADASEGPDAKGDADVRLTRARIPFGPFLILGCLELLFAGDWIASRLAPLFGAP